MLVKVKRIVGIVILAAVIITIIYVGAVRLSNKAPTLFGFSLLRVSTDSMEPALSVGEVVLVKDVEPETLKIGDVITYRATKGPYKGDLITHQISKEPYEVDGIYYFTTRGIKPEAVDDAEVTDAQIRGKVMYYIPYVGTVYDFFSRWYGMASLLILVVIIFSSEISSLFAKFKKEPEDKENIYENPNDAIQREHVDKLREKEFEGILTNLDEPDL